MRPLPRLVVTCLGLAAAGPAWASCAEDLTRIELSSPKAPADVQSRIAPLARDAEAKAKANDPAGCEALTGQALQALNLPALPPIKLSTPLATPEPPTRANEPSEPAASPHAASRDPRATGDQQSAASPPAGTTRAAAAEEPARQSASPTPNPARSPASGQAASPGVQQQAASQAAAPRPPAQPAGQGQGQQAAAPFFISSRELIGVEVRDRDDFGRTLGQVDSLIVDRATGRAVYVILSWGGFLGWDRHLVVIPYNLLSFSGRWDRPTLRVAASKIENAPQVRPMDLDNLLNDPDWRRAVVDYFGVGLAANDPQSGADGGGGQQPGGSSGPRQPAAGTPTGPGGAGPSAPSNPTGPTSDPKASPGEGATGPTAASGGPGASATSTAVAMQAAGGGGPDLGHGQATVQHVCAACHTFNQGGPTRVGPNLFGVGEREIASRPGYNYSAALKGHHGRWDEANLDGFLKSPRGYAPGTYMTFPGIRSDRDRRDVVAYLESLKGGTEPGK